MTQKPFPFADYWNAYAHDTRHKGASDPVQIVMARLRPDLKNGVLVDVGAGGGADIGFAGEDPRIGKIYAIDPAVESARVIKSSMLYIGTMQLQGFCPHFAKVETITKSIERVLKGKMPAADGIWVNAVMPYLPQEQVLPATEGLLKSLKRGGVFAANYAAQGFVAEPGLPPIACVTREELEEVLDRTGTVGTVIGYGHEHADLKPGERPIMYEVIAQRPLADAPPTVTG